MTFSITTPDPRFDPNEPVRVNGYLYLPAAEAPGVGFAIAMAVIALAVLALIGVWAVP